jgi:putative lipoic acid-binding regulatory protein
MDRPMFKNPQAVREQLKLPAVLSHSFVGLADPSYHARLEEVVVRLVGESNIRQRSFRNSAQGRYTAYRYDVYHDDFDVLEALYRAVSDLDGTKFIV